MRLTRIYEKRPKEYPVKCFCGSLMKVKWSGKFESWFYGCVRFPVCKGTHGMHPDGKPLGVPADPETKKWRIAAHESFDRLWKSGKMNRKEAYKWLAEKFQVAEIHIGEADIERCKEIIKVCS
jgi:ssDNA-binding Zn-finger/Zn-ribbon topoisomerase 1